MRHVLTMALAAVTLAACGDTTEVSGPALDAESAEALSSARTGPAGEATYEVSITNLTTEGQPLTPPLAATHRKPIGMFEVGEPASFGLKEIAENGNLGPMHERLAGSKHVADVVIAVAGDPPPVLPGQTVTFELAAERGARYLSFVSMLICTNDGFTGVNGLRLPDDVGESATVYTAAYDAGTEMNTEDFADMVPPCPALTGVPSEDPGTGASDPALAEGDVVRHHPGIAGIADLDPALHGWDDPVAMVTVERIH
jgi:hypothetical protein